MRESDERNPALPNMATTPEELTSVNNRLNFNRRPFHGSDIIINPNENAEYALQSGAKPNFSVESLDLNIDELTTKQLVKKLEAHLAKIFIPEE